MPRARHKNKAIIRLSCDPSRLSLCFYSKLVVIVVVIGLMETILKRGIVINFFRADNTELSRNLSETLTSISNKHNYKTLTESRHQNIVDSH